MNNSINSSIDSFIDNFFAKNDSSQLLLNNFTTVDCPSSIFKEINDIKRSNIVILFKLVIKQLFKHRSKVTLNLECKIFFNHLFVCLEKCLQHGLKPRKQMFGMRIDIWDVIESIEKKCDEAHSIAESVRHLPKIRTSLGKARAWFRLVMMHKRLSEFFQILIDNRETLLKDYYEDYALMMSEEANVIVGMLLGLNSFDYNIYIKDEFFDYFEPVINLKFYLKDFSASNNENSSMVELSNQQDDTTDSCCLENSYEDRKNGDLELQSLLDQNNYLEQLNQRLYSTIKELETKVKKNEKMSKQSNKNEDLSTKPRSSSQQSIMEFGTILAEKEKQLIEELRLKHELKKQIENEIKLREEAETARNLLETDIQRKQDTIISLRSQLDEVKIINLQLFKKLQESDSELKGKNVQLADNESRNAILMKEIKQLEKKLSDQSSSDKELLNDYQKMIDEQQEQMTQMQLDLEDLMSKNSINTHLKEAFNLLKKKYEENESALEEVGKQLQDAKLEIESLREYNGHLREAAWAKDSEATHCKQCEREFTIARRKHHCRSCGEIFCSTCSNNEMPLPSSKKPVRVCDNCHAFLLEKYSRPVS